MAKAVWPFNADAPPGDGWPGQADAAETVDVDEAGASDGTVGTAAEAVDVETNVDAAASVDVETNVGVAGDSVAIIVGNAAGSAVDAGKAGAGAQPARNTRITPRRIARENGCLNSGAIRRFLILR
jgi:hypothetical protein